MDKFNSLKLLLIEKQASKSSRRALPQNFQEFGRRTGRQQGCHTLRTAALSLAHAVLVGCCNMLPSLGARPFFTQNPLLLPSFRPSPPTSSVVFASPANLHIAPQASAAQSLVTLSCVARTSIATEPVQKHIAIFSTFPRLPARSDIQHTR